MTTDEKYALYYQVLVFLVAVLIVAETIMIVRVAAEIAPMLLRWPNG